MGVAVVESKGNVPVPAEHDRPDSLLVSLESMQAVSWQVKFQRRFRGVECRKREHHTRPEMCGDPARPFEIS